MTNDGNGAGRRTSTPSGTPVTAAGLLTQPATESSEMLRLTADISARLRGVCAHLDNEDFAQLVLDIARVRIRYDERTLSRATAG